MEENARLKLDLVQLKSRPVVEQDRLATAARGAISWRASPQILLARYILLPILLLVIAHYVLTLHFDTNEVYMRLTAIAIPLAFGFDLRWRARLGPGVSVASGIVVGVIAVAAMLTATAVSDGTSILPREHIGWQSTFEYAVSITLATVTGNIFAGILNHSAKGATPPGFYSRLTEFIAWMLGIRRDNQSFAEHLNTIETTLKAVTAVVAAVGAFYAGIKGVLPR
jgi:hypothetical protein